MLNTLKNFIFNQAIATIVLALFCLIAVKIILIIYDKLVKNSKLDPDICKILRIAIKSALLFMSIIIVLSSLGISVSSLVATLSVVGVAVSLAIQGFLSNVFGGIQIISNKPFKAGDYIQVGEESGTVREVGLFYTKLDTPDKKLIQIPNSTIAISNITNFSSAVNRRVDISVSASYDSDTEKVRAILLQMLNDHPLTLVGDDLAPVSHISSYNDSNITYIARCWCKSEHYWDIYFDIMDSIKPTFDEHGIKIDYPHINVHMKDKKAE